MIETDIVFFIMGAAIFLACHKVFHKQSSTGRVILCYCLGLISISFVVLYVFSLNAVPGENLYLLKKYMVGTFFPQFVLGLAAGPMLVRWANSPISFVETSATPTHISLHSGLLLLALFLAAILIRHVPEIAAGFSRIETPVGSFEFRKIAFEENGPEAQVVTRVEREDSSSSDVDYIYLGNSIHFVERDTKYVRLFRHNESKRLSYIQDTAKAYQKSISECFGLTLNNSTQLENQVTIERYDYAPFVRAIFQRLSFDARFWNRETSREETPREAFFKFFKEFVSQKCPSLNWDDLQDAYKLPYLVLTAAHLLEIAKHRNIALKILANWIDGSESLEDDDDIPGWYRVRALIHLFGLVEKTGDVFATYHVLRRSMQELVSSMDASSNKYIRDWKEWHNLCVRGLDISGSQDNITIPKTYLDSIYFTLMTQTNKFVEYAIRSDILYAALFGKRKSSLFVSDLLLGHTERNANVQERCYSDLAGDETEFFKAYFLATHGMLLVTLADSEYFISESVGKDNVAYLDGRAHLLRALSLLNPLEMKAQNASWNGKVADVIKHSEVRSIIGQIMTYLKRAEAGVGLP